MRNRAGRNRPTTAEQLIGLLVGASAVGLVVVVAVALMGGRPVPLILLPVLGVGAVVLFVLAADLLGWTSRSVGSVFWRDVIMVMFVMLALVAVIDPAVIGDQIGGMRRGPMSPEQARWWGVLILIAAIPRVILRLRDLIRWLRRRNA